MLFLLYIEDIKVKNGSLGGTVNGFIKAFRERSKCDIGG